MAAPLDSATLKQSLLGKLAPLGQEHLLAFWDRLSSAEQDELARQIERIDGEVLRQLQRQHAAAAAGEDQTSHWANLAARAEPPPAMRLDGGGVPFRQDAARAAGAKLLQAGQVGMILVAGGLGTRLGFDQPKGMLPIGPLSQRPLFQILIDQLRAASRRHGQPIPLYIMTSPATDAPTRRFLAEHGNFGLPPSDLAIFCQATMWALDSEWRRILLESPGSLFLGPDGHGGMLSALAKSGCLADAQRRGITTFFYGQIDNPLTQVCDELLLGSHVLAESELTTQVVRKRQPLERVGNVVSIDGRVQMIEYSDLPERFARQTNPDGTLKLWAGNLAVHVFDVDFLAAAAARPDALPFHAARKKVPCLDASGQLVEPNQPNAVRFERFIFDLLPLAERALVVEVDPAEAFAPVKNSDSDATDNPRSARAAMIALHRRWLRAAGANIADDVPVEINPLWAAGPDEIRTRMAGSLLVVGEPTYFSPTGPQPPPTKD
ncbi:MAG: UTP--glucose-1-phosphate uridylyltransferase [Pirellulaceae bacterium]|nr:UTP--glucose-1-phosphate uridylyltransferase [Pirellulaceae bacterium]